MLGWRGAARYHSSQFAPAFALECEAMRRVRGQMGLTNVELLIPFVRSVDELKQVLELLASEGLARGSGGEDTPPEVQAASNGKAVPGLKVHMMAELPVNCLSAAEFLAHVDGFSIGSNDLCQLTLGTDRDSSLVHAGDERDPAVKSLIAQAAMACAEAGKYSGICGQAPSDFPELAEWLVRSIRIGSISLNADVLLGTLGRIVEAEAPVGPPAEGTQMMTSKAAAASGGFEAATLSG
jgi:pyruvate,water dikinase